MTQSLSNCTRNVLVRESIPNLRQARNKGAQWDEASPKIF